MNTWLPKWAQVDIPGYSSEEITEALEDPEGEQERVEQPAIMGTELGKLALVNQLLESNVVDQALAPLMANPDFRADYDALATRIRSTVNQAALDLARNAGNPEVLEPYNLNNFYETLSAMFNDADISAMQEASINAIQNEGVIAAIKDAFQKGLSEIVMPYTQKRVAPSANAPFAPIASRRTRGKFAQQAPEQAPGPLLVPKYQSYEQLKNDLVALGPDNAYDAVFDEVYPEDQESAQEALVAFFQGYPEGLSSLYSLLVKSGKAEAIDTQMVETIMQHHPELTENNEPQKVAGLWLPPANASITTAEKAVKEASGSVGGPSPAYYTHGPMEKKFCPKLRNVTSTFVCRYHCLDGLAVDDTTIICGEALWRQTIMDKYSREYRDKDGNWVGGYINKRFEVERDTGGHPYQLKPGKRSSPVHEDAWSPEKRLEEMRRSESAKRNYSRTPGDPKGLYNWNPYDELGTTTNPQLSEKKKDPIAKLAGHVAETKRGKAVNPWAVCHTTADKDEDPEAHERCVKDIKKKQPVKASQEIKESESMWDEPTVAKKGKAVNPWAVCHTTVDKAEDPDKFERCVQDVKKKHPVKKDKKASTWGLQKEAYPSPMDPKNLETHGAECAHCKWSGPKETKSCPYCGGKMISRNKTDWQIKTRQLPPEESLVPSMASSRYSHGVYKCESTDGQVGYGTTLKEAQQRAGLEDVGTGTLEEESEEVANLMQEGTPEKPRPAVMPEPVSEMPEVPTQEIQGGVSELSGEAPDVPHAEGSDIDLAFSREIFEKTPEEQEEFEQYNQDSKVIGPDPRTEPVGQ